MHKNNRFSSLSFEDRMKVIRLCRDHTYKEVVSLLALPREKGGFAIQTSEPALSRFNRRFGAVADHYAVNQQNVDAINDQSVEGIDDAIYSLVQQVTFRRMLNSVDTGDFGSTLRQYLQLRSSRLQHGKWDLKNRRNRSMLPPPAAPSKSAAPEEKDLADADDFSEIKDTPASAETAAGDSTNSTNSTKNICEMPPTPPPAPEISPASSAIPGNYVPDRPIGYYYHGHSSSGLSRPGAC